MGFTPSKLLVTSMIIGGMAAHSGEIRGAINDILAEFQTLAVQYEMNGIARTMQMDQQTDNELPDDMEFGEYLREHMTVSPGAKRDTAKDPWGNRYALERGTNWFEVRSPGPDGIHGTNDDLASGAEW